MNQESSFKQEATSQYGNVSRRLSTDITSFSKIWNMTIVASGKYGSDHRATNLFKYVYSLSASLEQILHSLQCLHKFSTVEASNIFEFYVSFYLYDFLVRVKTVTDLLALTVNFVFKLGLRRKTCSLEKGPLCSRLTEASKSQDCTNNEMQQLSSRLDKARSSWLISFTELRDLVIHRAAIRFILMGVPDVGESRIHIATGEILNALHVADERQILSKFLAQVTPTSMSKYQTIDPVELCEQLWKRLGRLVELVMNKCQPKISALIAQETH